MKPSHTGTGPLCHPVDPWKLSFFHKTAFHSLTKAKPNILLADIVFDSKDKRTSIHAFLKISQIQRFIDSDNPLPPAEIILHGESPRVRSADADEGSKLSVAPHRAG